MEPRLSWLIIGAGAIGTYIGGSLLLHGEKVSFIEQPESTSQLIENGLKLAIGGQDYRIMHPTVFSSINEALSNSSADVAVFALKSYDTQAAVASIFPLAANFPPILCLQNGVENETALEMVVGKEKVIAGTVTSAVRRLNAGNIVLERSRGLGLSNGHPLSVTIARSLSEAGLKVRLYPDPLAMKWSKMLTNLLANASSAILDMAPGEILSDPQLYALEIEQLREAAAVMRALHLPPVNLPGTPVRLFTWAVDYLPMQFSQPFIARLAGHGRGQKMPSFHIDLYAGRGKSEVDYLNGAVARFGKRMNILTPVNDWFCRTLTYLTTGNLPRDEYSHQPDKLLRILHLSEVVD